LAKAGHLEQLRLPGLSADRAPVFPGGVAVLLAAFEALRIERMHSSDGALREGLLYDLAGRIRHEDIRARTVKTLAKRHYVDTEQAERVEQTALDCLKQVAAQWSLFGETEEQLLQWAARLHEIGLSVAHNQYHKHGAYILSHADLPGFSRKEQQLLATLVRAHRRKYPVNVIKQVPQNWRVKIQRLAILLRLAVLLQRSRSAEPLPALRLKPDTSALEAYFPGDWLATHPLTLADLAQESAFLKAGDFSLSFE
jgi:exopolyphosphatase / guanosine-5'-triphosphate,3'-diphosphate pyrophosphatase